jgi:hypothetical protein
MMGATSAATQIHTKMGYSDLESFEETQSFEHLSVWNFFKKRDVGEIRLP